ncbi:Coenzyme F420 hydrogenase/dehydrogenase, beta subunit C-terminal domain [Methanosphaera sp. ISO3-F5]|uniref:Coenzyme F420 hydrogenase/dehydrogenase, beta subunit C-terminal domain n=1 Tax=Methanosphaera sp. ISO3-F5 TaxID=1452353 RepID=UPI002B25D225|nr:Coenzyme F420 hydrogenase/dehydrogenase, beta subunit C-terminal domain [Methanosphaera sp. ISO3-F5]WQH64174.1 Coenzyme F420 hydrogenase/dehydrogenase, beta subunit C-terminal domain [Methanosphaera sp. ISO3-F5]
MSEDKIAIVGTPCEIMAASKIQHYTQTPIDFKIGLFCMENFSYSYFVKLLKTMDLTMEEIEKFRIEKGYAFLNLKNGKQVKISLSKAKTVVRKNCNICAELTSETSDISVGSIGSENGWSTIIIRTEKGEKIIEDAIKQKYLKAKELTPSQLKLLERISSNKTKTNYENIESRESRARPVLYLRDKTDESIMEEILESNFDDLRANVINVGACVLCGACEYVCPDDLILIKNTKPRKKRKKCPEDCHMCFTVCPRTFIPTDLRNDLTKTIGDYKKILTVKSLKHNEGQDGVVVTTILDYLLSNNIVTQTLVVDKKENLAWKPYAKLTKDVDEIVKASGTKYSVCPVFKPLKQLKRDVN